MKKNSFKLFYYRLFIFSFFAFGLLSQVPQSGFGQTSQSKLQYTANNSDQDTRASIEIDPTTLALSISIPLANFPGRKGGVPVNFRYASKVWKIKYQEPWPLPDSGNPVVASLLYGAFAEQTQAGWTTNLGIPYIEFTGSAEPFIARFHQTGVRRSQWPDYFTTDDGKPYDPLFPPGIGIEDGAEVRPWLYAKASLTMRMPDGSSHELRQADMLGFVGGLFKAVDGSRIIFDGNADILYLADGSRYDLSNSQAVKFIDPNGNVVSYAASLPYSSFSQLTYRGTNSY
ncbi:MAG: hypothetical protein HOP19_14815 [Acidobacteria bacterium]|nr:hypothetical protein [Acidobacteriota bacterium]